MQRNSRFWLIPLLILAVIVIGLVVLGLPPGAPTPSAYEKTLDVKAATTN